MLCGRSVAISSPRRESIEGVEINIMITAVCSFFPVLSFEVAPFHHDDAAGPSYCRVDQSFFFCSNHLAHVENDRVTNNLLKYV